MYCRKVYSTYVRKCVDHVRSSVLVICVRVHTAHLEQTDDFHGTASCSSEFMDFVVDFEFGIDIDLAVAKCDG